MSRARLGLPTLLRLRWTNTRRGPRDSFRLFKEAERRTLSVGSRVYMGSCIIPPYPRFVDRDHIAI